MRPNLAPRSEVRSRRALHSLLLVSQDSPLAGRRVFSTAQGSRLESFGWVEWALLCGVALIWGSSFQLIEIGLESLAPATITWVRVPKPMPELSRIKFGGLSPVRIAHTTI